MDFKVMNKAISTNETLFDDFDERPVDCDFVLPDYCPDIAAVLKCSLKPVIQCALLRIQPALHQYICRQKHGAESLCAGHGQNRLCQLPGHQPPQAGRPRRVHGQAENHGGGRPGGRL